MSFQPTPFGFQNCDSGNRVLMTLTSFTANFLSANVGFYLKDLFYLVRELGH